jgi:sugar O-acyltransferase (sialic acid O-acetyltransferase NeuD family)
VTQSLIILGASGNAWDLLDIIAALNAIEPTWEIRGILDDRRERGVTFAGVKVLGPIRDAANGFDDCLFINAIRSERTVRAMGRIIRESGLEPSRFATLIHPAASVSARAKVGRDVFINFGASVAGQVTLADHVSVGPNCIIGHDSSIDSYSSLAAGAILSGGVQVEESCYIGSGAVVRQQIRIGSGALVGMGAVVVKDVEPETTVVGNPAKTLTRHAHQPFIV